MVAPVRVLPQVHFGVIRDAETLVMGRISARCANPALIAPAPGLKGSPCPLNKSRDTFGLRAGSYRIYYQRH